jgi:hypothetical protein
MTRQDSWDVTTETGQPRQNNRDSTAGTIHLERTVGTGQSGQVSLMDQSGKDGQNIAGQGSWDRTTRQDHRGRTAITDRRGMTARPEQLGQENWNRSVWIGQLDSSVGTGQPGQGREERMART